MKKQDIIILVILLALWMAWPQLDRQIKKRFFPPAPVPEAVKTEAPETVADATLAEEPAGEPAAAPAQPAAAPEAEAAPVAAEPESAEPEKTAVLENDLVRITVSSRGASIASVEMKDKAYRQTVDPASGPVALDFGDATALAYDGLAGLGGRQTFSIEVSDGGRTARFERKTAAGLRLQRTMTLSDAYDLKVTDQLSNEGAAAVAVPAYGIRLGSMVNLKGEVATRGLAYLGVDTLSPGGEGVKHWGAKIAKWFDEVRAEKGLGKLPAEIEWPLDRPVDWVAAKNKYFAQVLVPEGGGDRSTVRAARDVTEAERQDPAFKPKYASVSSVSVSVTLPEFALEAGGSVSRPMLYYVGPKKYSELSRYGMHLVDVMEFGMWAPVGKVLLVTMNALHKYLWPHNYGLAIILLTILVRIVFWPITHKSTESMKKMQEIQPLVNAVREKYKDNAQKQQQEIMALYKEYKVNPLGGCLPTLIQIPVFIALFVVLRSAIELRFSSFLWVKDLSAPENLLAGVLPIPLNILPIFMAVTMAWQQKLTPSAGADPNQQKMMMFMPVMMLVLFYNFASGLALYWSTNQVLMIVQQLMMQRRKSKAQGLPAAAAAKAGPTSNVG